MNQKKKKENKLRNVKTHLKIYLFLVVEINTPAYKRIRAEFGKYILLLLCNLKCEQLKFQLIYLFIFLV